jgi:hypothetical protein
MDRTLVERHLAEAERRIAQGEKTVARQREIIATLERDGHDVSAAKQLLSVFCKTLELHRAERERCRGELGSPTED